MADIPESTKMDAVDILKTYADFIRNDVRADDFERHPYLPHIEQTIEDLRAAPPAMEREAVEKVARAMCADDGFDPDEHVIGGQAAGFEDFGPMWQAEERSEGQLGLTNYARLARAALSTLSADAIRQGEWATTQDFRAVPDGWKMVPTVMTPEMIEAWRSAPGLDCQAAYTAMLAATPASHASDGGEGEREVPKGMTRAYVRCRSHDRVAHYDYVPYSFSTAVGVMPCGCDLKHAAQINRDQFLAASNGGKA